MLHYNNILTSNTSFLDKRFPNSLSSPFALISSESIDAVGCDACGFLDQNLYFQAFGSLLRVVAPLNVVDYTVSSPVRQCISVGDVIVVLNDQLQIVTPTTKTFDIMATSICSDGISVYVTTTTGLYRLDVWNSDLKLIKNGNFITCIADAHNKMFYCASSCEVQVFSITSKGLMYIKTFSFQYKSICSICIGCNPYLFGVSFDNGERVGVSFDFKTYLQTLIENLWLLGVLEINDKIVVCIGHFQQCDGELTEIKEVIPINQPTDVQHKRKILFNGIQDELRIMTENAIQHVVWRTPFYLLDDNEVQSLIMDSSDKLFLFQNTFNVTQSPIRLTCIILSNILPNKDKLLSTLLNLSPESINLVIDVSFYMLQVYKNFTQQNIGNIDDINGINEMNQFINRIHQFMNMLKVIIENKTIIQLPETLLTLSFKKILEDTTIDIQFKNFITSTVLQSKKFGLVPLFLKSPLFFDLTEIITKDSFITSNTNIRSSNVLSLLRIHESVAEETIKKMISLHLHKKAAELLKLLELPQDSNLITLFIHLLENEPEDIKSDCETLLSLNKNGYSILENKQSKDESKHACELLKTIKDNAKNLTLEELEKLVIKVLCLTCGMKDTSIAQEAKLIGDQIKRQKSIKNEVSKQMQLMTTGELPKELQSINSERLKYLLNVGELEIIEQQKGILEKILERKGKKEDEIKKKK
ncbi:Uncharacterized protein QTN25_008855 [Entamoeba marina]